MNTVRRRARVLALNILYQCDAAGVALDEAVSGVIDFATGEAGGTVSNRLAAAIDYAQQLAVGVKNKRQELDGYISRLSEGWPLDRQPAVDRNILRIAMYEMCYSDNVPPAVAIDEAVDLAKKYGGADSGRFINGVLAAFLNELNQKKGEKSESSENP